MLTILFIGSLSIQSLVTLKALLNSGHSVGVIAIADSAVGLKKASLSTRPYIPVLLKHANDSILSVATIHGIPVILLDRQDTGERLQPYALDVGIVSCFPHQLQNSLLQIPRLGCYNLHPSLLPQYRGPSPLFWQFRNGESKIGITLHRMVQLIDAGPIVAWEQVPVIDGISETDLKRLCATVGNALIQTLLQQLESGSLCLTTQDEQQASCHSWPGEEDFHITTEWSARRVHNFICGTRHWGNPYILQLGRHRFSIVSTEGFSRHTLPDKDYKVDGIWLKFNCYDGCVTARIC